MLDKAKSEYQNPKFETNSNIEEAKGENEICLGREIEAILHAVLAGRSETN
jgi:hypothetical protein